MTTFTTFKAAREAGFVSAGSGKFHTYRLCSLVGTDCSGWPEYGYSFGFKIVPMWCDMTIDVDVTGSSESVWFSAEMNAVRQPGCFGTMFSAETMASAIQQMERAVDAWYRRNEEARAAEVSESVRRAAAAAREAARQVRRAEKRAAMEQGQ